MLLIVTFLPAKLPPKNTESPKIKLFSHDRSPQQEMFPDIADIVLFEQDNSPLQSISPFSLIIELTLPQLFSPEHSTLLEFVSLIVVCLIILELKQENDPRHNISPLDVVLIEGELPQALNPLHWIDVLSLLLIVEEKQDLGSSHNNLLVVHSEHNQ